MEELRQAYLQYLRKDQERSPVSQSHYRRVANHFLQFTTVELGYTSPKEAFKNAEIIREYLKSLYRKDLSRPTIQAYFTALRHFCDFLMIKGLATSNYADMINLDGGIKKPWQDERWNRDE